MIFSSLPLFFWEDDTLPEPRAVRSTHGRIVSCTVVIGI